MYCCFTHIKWEWWANEYWEFPNYMIVQLIYSILHDVFQPICLGFCLFYELVKINSHQMFLSNQAVGSWDASVSWWSFEPKSINKWMDKMDTNGQTWTKWRDSVNANSNARILFFPINKVCSAWTKTEGVTPKRGKKSWHALTVGFLFTIVQLVLLWSMVPYDYGMAMVFMWVIKQQTKLVGAMGAINVEKTLVRYSQPWSDQVYCVHWWFSSGFIRNPSHFGTGLVRSFG